jgi:nitroreductase
MAAVRAQGLDTCVLGGYAGPPKRRTPVKPLPPLEALPPDVAAEADAPIMAPAVDVAPSDVDSVEPIMTPTFSDGSLEPPAEAAPAEKQEAPAPEAAPPQ